MCLFVFCLVILILLSILAIVVDSEEIRVVEIIEARSIRVASDGLWLCCIGNLIGNSLVPILWRSTCLITSS